MPLYFAYGSNMDRAGMAARCPGARIVGLARVARHRLAIMREGYATVVRDPRQAVHGVLWEVPLSDIPALDRYEGVATGLYVKRQQPVVATAGVRKALIYFGSNAGPGAPLPGYLEGVLAAARELELPPAALAAIADLMPSLRASEKRTSGISSGPVAKVRPTRATPHDGLGPAERHRGRWTP